MSEMTGEPTSASVRAKTECTALILNQPNLLPREIHVKLLLSSARNVIQRLRLFSERQVHLMAEEADRQREILHRQIQKREQELTEKTGELRNAKLHLSSLFLQ